MKLHLNTLKVILMWMTLEVNRMHIAIMLQKRR
nr:MAG TPA: hypothetical protein [Caudoviricetes sp.]